MKAVLKWAAIVIAALLVVVIGALLIIPSLSTSTNTSQR